jgi:hypothetical protein
VTLHTDPHNHASRGAERIRTAVPCLSTSYQYAVQTGAGVKALGAHRAHFRHFPHVDVSRGAQPRGLVNEETSG